MAVPNKTEAAKSSYQLHKRQETLFDLLRTLFAILISLLIVFVVIFLVSEEPWQAISAFITGPFSTVRRMGNVLEKMTPLIFTGLAASIMFQAKQFSLIGDGSLYIGALTAVGVAVYGPVKGIPGVILAIVAAVLIGGLCGLLPGFLKAKWNTNEFVVSMMFNYILISLGQYVFLNMMRDPSSGNVATFPIPESMRFIKLIPKTKVHFGLIIALLVTVAAYVFLYKTKFGFAIRATGINRKYAKHIGINVFMVVMFCQVIGGALGGFGGAVEMFGMYDRFIWQDTLGFGFDGMTVAILAANNPALVPLGALFLAYLRVGTEVMARTNDMPNETVFIIQGIVMLLITAVGFLSHWRHKLLVKTATAQVAQKQEG